MDNIKVIPGVRIHPETQILDTHADCNGDIRYIDYTGKIYTININSKDK